MDKATVLASCASNDEQQQCETLVTAHGLDWGLIGRARAAGLSLSLILDLIVKYGPMMRDIIEQIIADLTKPKPAPAS